MKQYLEDRQIRAVLIIGATGTTILAVSDILAKAMNKLPPIIGDATHSGVAQLLALFCLAILSSTAQANILAIGLLVLIKVEYADKLDGWLQRTQVRILFLWPARWVYKTKIRPHK